MDGSRFDTLARSLTQPRSRRGLTRLLSAVALGSPITWQGLAETEAKKKKKVTLCHNGQTITVSKKAKKKHLKHGDTPGACPTAAAPVGPGCSDGIQNGNETGVDCGGSCKRCANGQACVTRSDCLSALCVDGVCRGCSGEFPCGTDVNGSCGCQAGTCFTAFGSPVPSCSACPSSWPCTTVVGGGELACYPPCGASETCGRADACNSNTPTCGQGGYCYQPLGGGPTRCGWPAPTPSCGCPSHAWCQASHGADAFCVTFDPEQGLCTCGEGGPTTFCAVPR